MMNSEAQRRPDLVLASTSPYRRALLARLRIPFDVVSPDWDEIRREEDPNGTVRENAIGKARAGSTLRPGQAVLGSDQVGWCAGRILEKPRTPERAIEQLLWLSGRKHTLHTCVALRMPDGAERVATIVARLEIRPLTREQIGRYVQIDSPLDCAGSYRFESLGVALFERITCDDPTAIEGLPLIATRRLLEEAGWSLP